MDLDKMIKRKDELGLSCVDITQRSGVPLSTVYKIFQGKTDNPRYETVQAIEHALGIGSDGSISDWDGTYLAKESDLVSLVQEATPYKLDPPTGFQHYKKQGEYTLEDYYKISDDYLCELIDGCIYDRSAPRTRHQLLIAELSFQIRKYVEKNEGPCIVFSANTDTHVDKTDRTVVQPDIFVICDPEKYKNGDVIWGAPDFVAEVLSPSTAAVDQGIKLRKYKTAGVREYWIIDYHARSIMIYDFTHGIRLDFKNFTDQIPMAIYDGDCVIDFNKIHEQMERCFGEYWIDKKK